MAFARLDAPYELSLPDSSRPAAAPARVDLAGPWKVVRTVDGVTHWETPVPIRPRALFFSSPGPGMSVKRDSTKLRYDRSSNSSKPNSWRYDADRLILRTDDGEPQPGTFTFGYPRATERERGLNLDTWTEDNPDAEQTDFIQRTLQVGTDARTGLLLPAPASAGWDVFFPPNATLQLDAMVIPPEIAEAGLLSDGAVVIVEVTHADKTVEIARHTLKVGEWTRIRADASHVPADTPARVTFRTEGGEDDQLDYVFLAEPTLYTPTTEPETIVMVFLDTLRADHLGAYGYERDVSPKLDAWAQGAMVFENARSVAPWTLPSTRTTLTGRQPEYWPREFGPNIAETLAAEGWATGAYVGNIYLSSNFDMSRGWSEYGCENWPLVDAQVEKAEAFLDRHPDRDRLVLLHTMDMHLPYTEPGRYRGTWAEDPPAGLNAGSERRAILSAYKKDPEAVTDWVIGRYDQNIQYTDDVLTPFLESLPDNATVLIFADHGEEFWDHNDFEHGHSLYDELLHVPLIIKSPGIPAGRLAEPVSLIDVTPTLLDIAGVKKDASVTGLSLVPAANGEEQARTDLASRPHSAGRPLYGDERWGVIAQDLKWTTHRGKEAVYDLKTDPGETVDLATKLPLQPLRDAFGEGLKQKAPLAWRVDVSKLSKSPKEPQTLNFAVPGGFSEAWLGQDPLKSAKMGIVKLDDGTVDVLFMPGKTGTREIYLVPSDPMASAGLTITGGEETFSVPEDATPKTGISGVANTRVANKNIKIGLAVAPVPEDGMQLAGVDSEVQAALDAMGYTEREEEEEE
ncbi:MAG: sulfatase-like hydrolase/transferase [Proteobacteria bacterium]|nr:sulfatase-like hydrolase/transferase [Pseudomonadota bacterium]MCP4915687.1 sulfatase-like hydrolase/transferase [Pseudomonadota bacterium]